MLAHLPAILDTLPVFTPGMNGVCLCRDPGTVRRLANLPRDADDTIVPHWGAISTPGEDGFTLVLGRDGRLAGQITVTLSRLPNRTIEVALETIFIHSAYRGKGAARNLADAALSVLGAALEASVAAGQDDWKRIDPDIAGSANDGGDAIMARMSQGLLLRLQAIEDAMDDPDVAD